MQTEETETETCETETDSSETETCLTEIDKMMDDYQSSDRLICRPDNPGMTRSLTFSITAAVLGMFQFGYNTGVINAPQEVIKEFYNKSYVDRGTGSLEHGVSTFLWSSTVAIFAIGGMLGGLLGPWWADKFGRKGGMLWTAPLGLLAAAFMGLSHPAKSPEMLIIGRFIVGYQCGLYTGLVPLYNAEIAPYRIRGGIGTVNQLATTLGLLVSEILGLPAILGTAKSWPFLLAFTSLPALLQLLMLPACPESPRYLLLTKREEHAAISALRKLRGQHAVGYEVDEMYSEQSAQREEKLNICQLCRVQILRLPVLIIIMMHLSQQLSGINCIFYYSTSLFKSVGLSADTSKYTTIGVGGLLVLMTLASVPLMDRLGRRTLHLSGLTGMFFFSILFTVAFTYAKTTKTEWLEIGAVFCALAIVVSFAIGPGSIPWLIMAEMFSQGPRPAAVGVGVLTNWLANFAVGQTFPLLQENLQTLVFIPFTVFLGFFIIFLYKFMPETKGRTFEEISALYDKQRANRTVYKSADNTGMTGDL